MGALIVAGVAMVSMKVAHRRGKLSGSVGMGVGTTTELPPAYQRDGSNGGSSSNNNPGGGGPVLDGPTPATAALRQLRRLVQQLQTTIEQRDAASGQSEQEVVAPRVARCER